MDDEQFMAFEIDVGVFRQASKHTHTQIQRHKRMRWSNRQNRNESKSLLTSISKILK